MICKNRCAAGNLTLLCDIFIIYNCDHGLAARIKILLLSTSPLQHDGVLASFIFLFFDAWESALEKPLSDSTPEILLP